MGCDNLYILCVKLCIIFAVAMKNTRINTRLQLRVPSRFRSDLGALLDCVDLCRQKSALKAATPLTADCKSALKPDAWRRYCFDRLRMQMESPDTSLSSFMDDCLNRLSALARWKPPTRSRGFVRNGVAIRAAHLPREPDP